MSLNIDKSHPFGQKRRDKKELIFLILILLLASFFRLYKLDSIPPGIYPDEALNGNQAMHQAGQIFYPENNGREGLFINITALSFRIFGPSIWSFKIVSATCGILTVLGVYLLTKELFESVNSEQRTVNNKLVALLAAFLLSVSFWHTNFSRISFRAIMVPFFSVFGFYFLFKGFRKQKIIDFVISGALLGLGFYTYIAFRMVYLALFIVLFFQWLIYRQKKQQKQFFFALCSLLFALCLIASPLLLYFARNPADFIGRTQGVSVFSQENPVSALIRSLIVHLGMFNFYGDANWRHNISGSPVLFWPVGILFLTGLIYSIRKSMNSFKNKNYSLLTTNYLLLSWWFIMLLPGVLTYEGIPHSLRCIGAIPPTFILAGLGAGIIYEFIKKKIPFSGRSFSYYLVLLTLILLAGSFIFSQYVRYFEIWAKNPETENAFSKDLVEIGNYLNSLPEETQKYVLVNLSGVLVDNIPMPAQTPMFIENLKFGKTRAIYILPENLEMAKINKGAVIVPLAYGEELFTKLMALFPKGVIKQENNVWVFRAE